MSEDTNTNEKKFHLDEFAMLLGNRMNARREEGGQVCCTIFPLEHLSKHVNQEDRFIIHITVLGNTCIVLSISGARHEAATCDLWRADFKVSLNLIHLMF